MFWNALWFKRNGPLKKHHFSLVGVRAGSVHGEGHRAHTGRARPSNLKKDLTTKIDTLDIFQPRLATRQARGLSMWGVGVPLLDGARKLHALPDGSSLYFNALQQKHRF